MKWIKTKSRNEQPADTVSTIIFLLNVKHRATTKQWNKTTNINWQTRTINKVGGEEEREENRHPIKGTQMSHQRDPEPEPDIPPMVTREEAGRFLTSSDLRSFCCVHLSSWVSKSLDKTRNKTKPRKRNLPPHRGSGRLGSVHSQYLRGGQGYGEIYMVKELPH